VIDDDVAVKDSLYTTGRRGVGATVLIEKICGASAEQGADLAAVAALAKRCKDNARSMGMALTSCAVPAAGKPTFDIGDDEIEMGVGIHGEPGRTRIKMKPANELVDMMMAAILDELPFKAGEEAIVMVNGMGGTPLLELYIAYAQVAKVAKAKGFKIARNLVGNYITSLEMQGFSITMLKADKEMLSLWDAPVCTPGLRWGM
jgi:dihydroxyacetone kinase-like protein